MSTAYEIPGFLKRVRKYVDDKNPHPKIINIADMVRIIPHATAMMPWVHITKEWEVMAHENVLTLTGILAPRLFANLVVSNGHMKIILIEVDELNDTRENQTEVLNITVSVQEADIIYGLSKMLNAFHHQTSIGLRRHFLSHTVVKHDFETYVNELNQNDYVIVGGSTLWVAPNMQTFYDLDTKQWIHLKEDILKEACDNLDIVWDSSAQSHPLPPAECV